MLHMFINKVTQFAFKATSSAWSTASSLNAKYLAPALRLGFRTMRGLCGALTLMLLVLKTPRVLLAPSRWPRPYLNHRWLGHRRGRSDDCTDVMLVLMVTSPMWWPLTAHYTLLAALSMATPVWGVAWWVVNGLGAVTLTTTAGHESARGL